VRRIIPLFAAVLVLATLPWPPGPAIGAERESFMLAVLRRDGVVIPFAHYNARTRGLLQRGGRWLNPWPEAGKDFEIPLQLSDVPDDWWPGRQPVTSWTAWPLQGAKTEIESQAPVAVIAHCQLGLGIRTSYKPPEPPPPENVQPYPKDGLATSGPVTVERPVLLEPSANEWKAASEAVATEVTYLEEKVVTSLTFGARWHHPASSRERATTPFTPETIIRVTPRALYFEGVKTYGPPAGVVGRRGTQVPNRCNILTYAAGWVLFSSDGKPKVRASADVTDCNREGMVYSLPLGIIPQEDGVLSIVQVSGWGYERYEALEVRGDEVKLLLAVPGGWCRGT